MREFTVENRTGLDNMIGQEAWFDAIVGEDRGYDQSIGMYRYILHDVHHGDSIVADHVTVWCPEEFYVGDDIDVYAEVQTYDGGRSRLQVMEAYIAA